MLVYTSFYHSFRFTTLAHTFHFDTLLHLLSVPPYFDLQTQKAYRLALIADESLNLMVYLSVAASVRKVADSLAAGRSPRPSGVLEKAACLRQMTPWPASIFVYPSLNRIYWRDTTGRTIALIVWYSEDWSIFGMSIFVEPTSSRPYKAKGELVRTGTILLTQAREGINFALSPVKKTNL